MALDIRASWNRQPRKEGFQANYKWPVGSSSILPVIDFAGKRKIAVPPIPRSAISFNLNKLQWYRSFFLSVPTYTNLYQIRRISQRDVVQVGTGWYRAKNAIYTTAKPCYIWLWRKWYRWYSITPNSLEN